MQNKRAIDKALVQVKYGIDALRRDVSKWAAIKAGKVAELPNPLTRHDDAA